MAQQLKATVQGVSNKVYAMGGKHLAGQHSLTGGEAVCAVIAGLMIFAPSIWQKMPVIGKYSSATIAFLVMLFAFIMW